MKKNNVWVEIKSEYDLPQSTEYWVVINGIVKKAYYSCFNKWLLDGNNYPKSTETLGISHYQEIKPPLLPKNIAKISNKIWHKP